MSTFVGVTCVAVVVEPVPHIVKVTSDLMCGIIVSHLVPLTNGEDVSLCVLGESTRDTLGLAVLTCAKVLRLPNDRLN